MIRKINILTIFLLIIITIISTTCYAEPVTVTHENLRSTFQKFIESESNENNYTVFMLDNLINISVDNQNYTLNYDLTSKPTFWLEITVQQGMTYQNFTEQINNLTLPMLGYIAVADIQGIKFEDASAYFLFSYLGGSLDGAASTQPKYTIVDDTNLTEGVTIEPTNDPNTIYASQFGNRVMEYVNDLYKEKQTITDSTGINSYEWTVERKDVTDTSCKIVSTLSVNLDANFLSLNGYSSSIGDSMGGSPETNTINGTGTGGNTNSIEDDNTIGNELNNVVNNSINDTNLNKNEVDEDEKLPQTGAYEEIISMIILGFTIIAILLWINNKKYKNVK